MWILPGGDDQMHLGWQVLDHEGEGTVNRFGINSVVVVEDKDEIIRDVGDLVEQGRQDRFGRRLGGLIVILWRAGLRIQEALSLGEADLDQHRGSLLVRHGKGGRRREVGMDAWA